MIRLPHWLAVLVVVVLAVGLVSAEEAGLRSDALSAKDSFVVSLAVHHASAPASRRLALEAVQNRLNEISEDPEHPTIKAEITRSFDGHVFPGFASLLTPDAVTFLSSLPDVAFVEPNVMMYTTGVQAEAPWNLDRLDAFAGFDLAFNYGPSTGSGVNVFVLDTGVLPSHSEFGGEGRVSSYFDAFGEDGIDCNGHGTHVIGNVAGSTFGVAKEATVLSGRVLGCDGSGRIDGIIAALETAQAMHESLSSTDPVASVVSMSLGGGYSRALNDAVDRVVDGGVTVIVAAGNDNVDTCSGSTIGSPASAPSAITVGSHTKDDTASPFSNHGPCVDIFAPGSGIESAWYTDDDATNTLSGTSMATPHVSGAVALWLELHPTASPDDVRAALACAAIPNILGDMHPNTPNTLLRLPSLVGNQCADGCAECDPLTPQVCLQCDPASDTPVLDGWTCVRACPGGATLSGDGSQCVCEDPTAVRYKGTCLVDEPCPEGTYADDDGVCRRCHSSCQSCSGPEATECTACRTSAGLPFLEAGICVKQCSSGSYGHWDGVCRSCDPSCADCTGPSPTQCTRCPALGTIFFDTVSSTCQTACPAGTYALMPFFDGGLKPMCRPCSSSCATCNGPSSSQCTSCPAGKLQSGFTCVDSCPAGTHPDPLGTGACVECDGTSCTPQCPFGEYATADGTGCAPCHGKCRFNALRDESCPVVPDGFPPLPGRGLFDPIPVGCAGPSADDCWLCGNGVVDPGETCDHGTALEDGCCGAGCQLLATCDPEIHACCSDTCEVESDVRRICRPGLSFCDPGEFCDGTSFECPPDMLKGDGTQCRDDEGGLGACLSGGCRTMLAACQEYRPEFGSLDVCAIASDCGPALDCHLRPDKNYCHISASSYFTLITRDGTVVDHYSPSQRAKHGLPCSLGAGIGQCDGLAGECRDIVPCPDPSLPFLLVADGSCAAACPAGTYVGDDGTSCLACHPTCQECGGPGRHSCLTCPELLTPVLTASGTCVADCPVGFYPSPASGGGGTSGCVPCDDVVCPSVCAPGQFKSASDGLCHSCEPHCGTDTECTSPTACSVCGNGVKEGDEDCDGGPCCDPTTCTLVAGATCDGATDACCDADTCSVASAGTVCRPSVDAGCDDAETCDGSAITCPADTFSPDGTACSDVSDLYPAGEGYPGVCVDRVCQSTDKMCREYTERAWTGYANGVRASLACPLVTDCSTTRCDPWNSDEFDTSASNTCGVAYGVDAPAGVPCLLDAAVGWGQQVGMCDGCGSCVRVSGGSSCAPQCATCDGPDAQSCLTCADGLLQLGTFCLETCPSGTHPSSDGECVSCSAHCLECTDGGCLACSPDAVLLGSGCVSPEECEAKVGPGAAAVVGAEGLCSCPAGLVWSKEADSCVDAATCEPGTLPGEAACEPCPRQCRTCAVDGTGVTHCTSCVASSALPFLDPEGACVSTCPPGSVLNTDTNTCDVCAPESTDPACVATCGNGVVDPNEDCECPASGCRPDGCCLPDCTFRLPAFECDVDNPLESACCTASCMIQRSDKVLCRPSEGECDVPEFCSGTSATCPGDVYIPAGTQCRDDDYDFPGACYGPKCVTTDQTCKRLGYIDAVESDAGCRYAESCTSASCRSTTSKSYCNAGISGSHAHYEEGTPCDLGEGHCTSDGYCVPNLNKCPFSAAPLYDELTDTCVPTNPGCPDGTYLIKEVYDDDTCGTADAIEAFFCRRCPPSCETCSADGTTCLTCSPTAPVLLDDGRCGTGCPAAAGQYRVLSGPDAGSCAACDGVVCAIVCPLGTAEVTSAGGVTTCDACPAECGAGCHVGTGGVLECSACGDGIVSGDEQCDCGGSDCSEVDPCCDGATCTFADPTYTCSPAHSPCCTDSCSVVAASANSVCRAAASDCDAVEVCNGATAACPPDVALPTGADCMDTRSLDPHTEGFPGRCFAGVCQSTHAHCAATTWMSAAATLDPLCAVSQDCSVTRCTSYPSSSFSTHKSCGTSWGSPQPVGTPCLDGQCDGDGNCVDLTDSDASGGSCHPSCKECSAPAFADACTVCASDAPFRVGTRCFTACPAGFVRASSVTFDCVPCPDQCTSCDAPHAQACTACTTGWLLAGSVCVESCPPGASATGGACVCDVAGLVLSPDVATGCVASCPAQTYPDTAACMPCDGTCATCSGPGAGDCTSCHTRSLLPVLDDGTCAAECPGDHFANDEGVCTACDSSCASCTAGGDASCTSCPSGFLLHGSICVTSCPAGFYHVPGTALCEACSTECTTCDRSADMCTTCPAGALLVLGEPGTSGTPSTSTCVVATVCPVGTGQEVGGAGGGGGVVTTCVPCDNTNCPVACPYGFYSPTGTTSSSECAACDQCGDGVGCVGPTVADCTSCGDGVVDPEEGEECDCGQVLGCDGSTCCGAMCRLTTGSVCDPVHDPCCTDECQVTPDTARVCRPSLGGCDPAEVCNGVDYSCPPDRVRVSGFSCLDGEHHGACFGAKCATLNAVCRGHTDVTGARNLWAPPGCFISSCDRASCSRLGTTDCGLTTFWTSASWFNTAMEGVPCAGGQCDDSGVCKATTALSSGLCDPLGPTPFVLDGEYCVAACPPGTSPDDSNVCQNDPSPSPTPTPSPSPSPSGNVTEPVDGTCEDRAVVDARWAILPGVGGSGPLLLTADPAVCPEGQVAVSTDPVFHTDVAFYSCGFASTFNMVATDSHCEDTGVCGEFHTESLCAASGLACEWTSVVAGDTPSCMSVPCPSRPPALCTASPSRFFGAECQLGAVPGSGCEFVCPPGLDCVGWQTACGANPATAVLSGSPCFDFVDGACTGMDAEAAVGYCAQLGY